MRSIDVRDGRVLGVTLESGEELRAPVVVSGAHPKTTVLDLAGAEHFPDEVVEDLRRYKTRGGSVKVNWVLSEPPRYEGVSDEDRHMLLRSGVAFCPSIDYLERAWQDAVRGRPSEAPYLEVEVPDDDRRHADRRRLDRGDDVHPVRARTTRRAGPRARASATGSSASTRSARWRRT